MRILILGYYFKQNFGDDLFQLAFQNSFPAFNIEFSNLENITNFKLGDYDTVIIGGGDVVNRYYLTDAVLDKLAQASSYSPTNIVFYSFGLSFPQLVSEGVLDPGHFFFPRNKHDYEFLKYRFGNTHVKYTPDMSFLLANSVQDNFPQTPKESSPARLKIGMCLPFPWFAKGFWDGAPLLARTSRGPLSTDGYARLDNAQTITNNPLLSQIVQLVVQLTSFGDVHFIPFDTSNNPMNSDLILSQIIKNALPPECHEHVFFINDKALNGSPETKLQMMNDFFLNLDIVFASRFHSVIMSLLTCTPFISLYASKKIQTIIPQMGELHSQFVSIPTNDSGVPISIGNPQDIIRLFHETLSKTSQIKTICKSIKERDHALATRAKNDLMDIVLQRKFRYSPPQCIVDSLQVEKQIIRNVITFALQRFGTLSIRNIERMLRENESLSNVLPKTAKSPFTQRAVTEEILWQITGDPHGPYFYGLYNTVLTKQFIPQIKWIISDYNTKYRFKMPSDGVDSPIVINKNFQEIHRSGWQYALNNLLTEKNFPSNIIIDTYVDKTFHWNREFYLSKKIIPYTSPWIGFIHHTFSDYNNKFNCSELVKNTAFLQSLATCKCLIVMSKYLQQQLIDALNITHPDKHVPIHVIYHPTEFVSKNFDWNSFSARPEKTLVQIGNWLRNVFSIYRLDLPKDSIITQKAILRNRNSDSYFLPSDFYSQTFGNFIENNDSIDQGLDMCRIAFSNMHVKGLFQVIDDMERSVVQIDHLMDDQYDDLLASSIVFIDLVDASAVNTLIECIARNTPIMINPIEPVVELLGTDYPLYYSSYYEGSKLLENTNALYEAHLYLQRMDKSFLKVETFCNAFNEIVNSFGI